MSIKLEPKTGLELVAGFAICALVLAIGNNSSWNVFADSCTTCGNVVPPTVDFSKVIVNAGAAYMNKVTDDYSNYQSAINQAYTAFIAAEKSDPTISEDQYDNAIHKAKMDLTASLLKAELEYEAIINQLAPSEDA